MSDYEIDKLSELNEQVEKLSDEHKSLIKTRKDIEQNYQELYDNVLGLIDSTKKAIKKIADIMDEIEIIKKDQEYHNRAMKKDFDTFIKKSFPDKIEVVASGFKKQIDKSEEEIQREALKDYKEIKEDIGKIVAEIKTIKDILDTKE
tara:strand:+ start:1109 stop:1549 length:441 start_codon:yes stop_codon:yes gene_type:complete